MCWWISGYFRCRIRVVVRLVGGICLMSSPCCWWWGNNQWLLSIRKLVLVIYLSSLTIKKWQTLILSTSRLRIKWIYRGIFPAISTSKCIQTRMFIGIRWGMISRISSKIILVSLRRLLLLEHRVIILLKSGDIGKWIIGSLLRGIFKIIVVY